MQRIDLFFGPPPRVTRYFKHKGIWATFHWQIVDFDEYTMTFTVEKSAAFHLAVLS